MSVQLSVQLLMVTTALILMLMLMCKSSTQQSGPFWPGGGRGRMHPSHPLATGLSVSLQHSFLICHHHCSSTFLPIFKNKLSFFLPCITLTLAHHLCHHFYHPSLLQSFTPDSKPTFYINLSRLSYPFHLLV